MQKGRLECLCLEVLFLSALPYHPEKLQQLNRVEGCVLTFLTISSRAPLISPKLTLFTLTSGNGSDTSEPSDVMLLADPVPLLLLLPATSSFSSAGAGLAVPFAAFFLGAMVRVCAEAIQSCPTEVLRGRGYDATLSVAV